MLKHIKTIDTQENNQINFANDANTSSSDINLKNKYFFNRDSLSESNIFSYKGFISFALAISTSIIVSSALFFAFNNYSNNLANKNVYNSKYLIYSNENESVFLDNIMTSVENYSNMLTSLDMKYKSDAIVLAKTNYEIKVLYNNNSISTKDKIIGAKKALYSVKDEVKNKDVANYIANMLINIEHSMYNNSKSYSSSEV